MRVLVTGSSGFLGSTLVRKLSCNGHTVIGLDKNLPPPSSALPFFIHHDLRDRLTSQAPTFDCCVHLASSVGGFLHNAASANLEENEILLLETTAQICRTSGCKRILYASSILVFEVTGDYLHAPALTGSQRTPYARAKATGEDFVSSHFEEFVIFRPTNLFGPHQPREASAMAGRSHVIPDLLYKLHRESFLEVLGDGSQVRNFLHVEDAASFIAIALNSPAQGYYNLRSDIHLTIRELALELKRWAGVEREVRYRPEFMKWEPNPIPRFDIAPLEDLGWAARIQSLPEGLGDPHKSHL